MLPSLPVFNSGCKRQRNRTLKQRLRHLLALVQDRLRFPLQSLRKKEKPMEAQASREMPRYKCHKEVWALKIAHIAHVDVSGKGGAVITPVDEGYAPFEVDGQYVAKHLANVE